jgi:hypothetical protein
VLASGAAPVTPLPRSAPVYWLWNEVADLLFSALPRALLSWQLFSAAPAAVDATFARLRNGVDAVLDAEDPLPFLALHYGQARSASQPPTHRIHSGLADCALFAAHAEVLADEHPLLLQTLHHGQESSLAAADARVSANSSLVC